MHVVSPSRRRRRRSGPRSAASCRSAAGFRSFAQVSGAALGTTRYRSAPLPRRYSHGGGQPGPHI